MINQRALDLIKEFEGFRAKAYADPVGVWTIGYGTTARAGLGIDPKPGMTITEAEADRLLRAGVDKFAAQVMEKLTRAPTDNQFGAMVSLAYNIGPGEFAKSSVLRMFNRGDTAAAADAFLLWDKADGKVMPGLVRRRKAERALFLAGAALAPKPVADKKTAPADTKPDLDPPGFFWRLITAAIAAIFAKGKH